MDTLFLVHIWIDKEKHTLGPYYDIQYATMILVDIVPQYARCNATAQSYEYKAEVHESILIKDKGWSTISIPLTENTCRKTKVQWT